MRALKIGGPAGIYTQLGASHFTANSPLVLTIDLRMKNLVKFKNASFVKRENFPRFSIHAVSGPILFIGVVTSKA